jgi:hypothetical protein
MPKLEDVFESFNWKVHSADATSYEGVYAGLEAFRFGPRNGQPTAIISHSTKGYGALSDFMNKHKVVVAENLSDQEEALQHELRARRVDDFRAYYERLSEHARGAEIQDQLKACARDMHLDPSDWSQILGPLVMRRVPARDKRIRYNPDLLPKIDPKKEYSAADIVTGAMKVFARDSRVVSIDSDLATTKRPGGRRGFRGSTPRATPASPKPTCCYSARRSPLSGSTPGRAPSGELRWVTRSVSRRSRPRTDG